MVAEVVPGGHEVVGGACEFEDALGEPFGQGGARRPVADPETRLRPALGEMYALLCRTEGMLEKPSRDAPYVPVSV